MSGSAAYFQRLEAIDDNEALDDATDLARYKAAQQAARETLTPPFDFGELFILRELGLAVEYISGEWNSERG